MTPYVTLDWQVAINESYSYFHSQFIEFIEKLTHFGKFDEAQAFIKKYRKLISNKGLDYLRYCKAQSYFYWFQSDFEEAIKYAEDGIALQLQNNIKNSIDLKHALALALRDTKKRENIEKAISIFQANNSLEDIINSGKKLFVPGEKYGNIARCLQFLGRVDEAIICLKKSIQTLDEPMNIGYGYLWIGECLFVKKDFPNTLRFYRQTLNTWKTLSPVKASHIKEMINKLLKDIPELNLIANESDKEIDKFCKNWIGI